MTRIVVLLAATATLLGGCSSGAIPARDAVRGHGLIPPLQSIIESTHALVIGRTNQVHEARWNSADGSDWSHAYRVDPERYASTPFRMTTINLIIDEVAYRGNAYPPIRMGDEISIAFTGDPQGRDVEQRLGRPFTDRERHDYVELGKTRAFLLQWTTVPTREGRTDPLWWASPRDRIWAVVEGKVVPAAVHQQASAHMSGFTGIVVEGSADAVGIPVDALAAWISESSGASVG